MALLSFFKESGPDCLSSFIERVFWRQKTKPKPVFLWVLRQPITLNRFPYLCPIFHVTFLSSFLGGAEGNQGERGMRFYGSFWYGEQRHKATWKNCLYLWMPTTTTAICNTCDDPFLKRTPSAIHYVVMPYMDCTRNIKMYLTESRRLASNIKRWKKKGFGSSVLYPSFPDENTDEKPRKIVSSGKSSNETKRSIISN